MTNHAYELDHLTFSKQLEISNVFTIISEKLLICSVSLVT